MKIDNFFIAQLIKMEIGALIQSEFNIYEQ